mmetsp:Transcript_25907/g.69232  ORF Transcript_25907/g.69232 Transcript_25907/m.69232 type:complete len:315 (-) Transcript_25907:22-966(-)
MTPHATFIQFCIRFGGTQSVCASLPRSFDRNVSFTSDGYVHVHAGGPTIPRLVLPSNCCHMLSTWSGLPHRLPSMDLRHMFPVLLCILSTRSYFPRGSWICCMNWPMSAPWFLTSCTAARDTVPSSCSLCSSAAMPGASRTTATYTSTVRAPRACPTFAMQSRISPQIVWLKTCAKTAILSALGSGASAPSGALRLSPLAPGGGHRLQSWPLACPRHCRSPAGGVPCSRWLPERPGTRGLSRSPASCGRSSRRASVPEAVASCCSRATASPRGAAASATRTRPKAARPGIGAGSAGRGGAVQDQHVCARAHLLT